jgi:HK97 family phage prohead protease
MESEQDVRAFVEHDSKQKLGRRKSNTLRLAVDDKGIKAEIDVPPTTIGNDLVADMQRGEYDGMSFRFYKLRDNWKVDGDTRVREVTDMVFDEISVVGSPAYANTSVALRSMAEAFEALPDKDKQLKLMAMELRIAELDS